MTSKAARELYPEIDWDRVDRRVPELRQATSSAQAVEWVLACRWFDAPYR
jgi:hypothetical protein